MKKTRARRTTRGTLAGVALGVVTITGLSTSPAAAAVLQHQINIPFSTTVDADCNGGSGTGLGEILDISGNGDLRYALTSNGNNWSEDLQFMIKGVAVGEDSGNRYRVSIMVKDSVKGSLQNGSHQYTYSHTEKLTGEGSAPNLELRAALQYTVNANGIVTVDRVAFTPLCS